MIFYALGRRELVPTFLESRTLGGVYPDSLVYHYLHQKMFFLASHEPSDLVLYRECRQMLFKY